MHSLSGRETQINKFEKTQIINSLRPKYRLEILLLISKLPKSTYYSLLKFKDEKHKELKAKIQLIFNQHKARYGYRRINQDLRNNNIYINAKTVLKLMRSLNLKAKTHKIKYNSYKGELGKLADNVLNRNFKAYNPDEKWVTDVTQFNVCGNKVYLSPIMDLYNNEIISYAISQTPSFWQTKEMLEKAFKVRPHAKPVFHSDQGWQYQMNEYQRALKNRGITQSMSRKGTCLDNASMESFFGKLKQEMFYKQKFKSVDHFIHELKAYIDYYNNIRISLKLKGLSPVQYRLQSLI